ncbi:hypothetical protein SBV1_410127 [Verrucomicrobia bacterium]|nr:hypothetical protein SBV1_410127 [Verrucomicrobiota bacterium]
MSRRDILSNVSIETLVSNASPAQSVDQSRYHPALSSVVLFCPTPGIRSEIRDSQKSWP